METLEFKIGNVVTTKDDTSPRMTVSAVNKVKDSSVVECIFFKDGVIQKVLINSLCLEKD